MAATDRADWGRGLAAGPDVAPLRHSPASPDDAPRGRHFLTPRSSTLGSDSASRSSTADGAPQLTGGRFLSGQYAFGGGPLTWSLLLVLAIFGVILAVWQRNWLVAAGMVLVAAAQLLNVL